MITRNRTRTVLSLAVVAMAIIGLTATSADAKLVLEEQFIYEPPEANIDTQNGGTGFDGPWVSTISHGRIYWIRSPGLEFSTLPVAGNALSRYGSAGRAQAHRLLSSESKAALTRDNTTIWFSVLFQEPANQYKHGSFLFGTYKFSTQGVPVLGDGDEDRNPPFTPVNGDGFGFTIQAAPDGSTQGTGTINALAFDNSSAPIVVQGTFTPDPITATVLIVGKINWKADGTPDELFLFNVTDLSSEPAEAEAIASITNLDFDQSAFDRIAMWDSNNAITDEIRFGTSFADVMGVLEKAANPSPADGAMNEYIYVSLQWSPGNSAVSHDVYLGDNFDDVNDGTGDTFQGNQTNTDFIAGFLDYPFPEGLVPGTTYYWRIDEVNDADPNSPWKGDVWSFWIPSKKAYEPKPTDGTIFVDTNVTLSWTAGFEAIWHTVYFGDDFDTVNNATGGTSNVLIGYSPGPLEYGKTYYWRVDETDTLTTHKGDVWSFTTTLPGLGTIVQEKWNNIDGADLDTLKDYWKYPNNPDETKTLNRFDTGTDLDDNYGGKVYGWVYAPATGDYTFWLCTDDNGELWLSTDDDSSNIRLIASESTWRGPNSWGTGEEQSDPISLVGGNKYYIMALWKEGGGGDHCQVAWQGPGIPTPTIIPGTNLSPYEPLKAYGAKPTNNATGVTQMPVLQWKPGLQAASHEVYFGTDKDAVESATKTSPQYKGTRALGDENYDPGKLAWESTYYWRIDEVNNVNPDSPWISSVWSFTTADFIILDDFEAYDANDNQIWYAWRDGLGFGAIGVPPYSPGNGTGSAVGDETTDSYTEESIVHGGRQSMPYWYDNNKSDKAKYSEAKLTMGANARDWTDGGVKALSLWFQGYPGYVGSFTESPAGTYTMTASGYDIWYDVDEFHYAFKMLTGVGTIAAQVLSVDNTDVWAKAGVMIRETLDPNSAHAMMVVTPGQGVSFQRRPGTGATSEHTTTGGITAPHWVRLERDLAGNFTAYHSTDGSTWEMQGTTQNIPMSANVYIGLAVTAHNAAATCEAVFSNVTITDTVGQQWMHQDIGIMSNAAEPMYVAVANNTGPPVVVYHDDPNAAQIDTWTEWNIDLKDFADQGVILTDVNSIAIGFGNRNNTQAGGSGKMYFDDIRLYRPRFIPGKGTPLLADLNSDGVVDMADVEVMAADWLANGLALAGDLNTDGTVDFKDYAVLADMWLEEQLWPE